MRREFSTTAFTQVVDFHEAPRGRGKAVSRKFTTGFTLVELLLVVTLITIFAGATFGTGLFSVRTMSLKNVVAQTRDAIQLARMRAIAADGPSAWGVYASGSTITVFRGDTYATRNATYDDITTFPDTVTATGEVDFIERTGRVSATSDIVLTQDENTQTVRVNTEGTLETP